MSFFGTLLAQRGGLGNNIPFVPKKSLFKYNHFWHNQHHHSDIISVSFQKTIFIILTSFCCHFKVIHMGYNSEQYKRKQNRGNLTVRSWPNWWWPTDSSNWAKICPTNMIILASLRSRSKIFRTHHSNVILISFRCSFVAPDMAIILWWNDPKMRITLVTRSFLFQNETERNEFLVRRNDRNTVGTTLTVGGRGPERWRARVERSMTSSHSVFRSCHSSRVPRSGVNLYRSRREGDFGTTPERGRNGEGGRAKVGWFPRRKMIK